MFEIVKREHTRELSNLVSATSDGVTAPSIGYVRQANAFSEKSERAGLSDDVLALLLMGQGADIDHESNQVP